MENKKIMVHLKSGAKLESSLKNSDNEDFIEKLEEARTTDDFLYWPARIVYDGKYMHRAESCYISPDSIAMITFS